MPQKSINQITTLIAEKLKRETDEVFKRMLAPLVDGWRSTLISRSLEKHPDQRNFFTQTLWLPMECHSLIPCPTPMTLCNIMQSKDIVPAPLRFGTTLFDYVGSIDGLNPFRVATSGTFLLLKANKYQAGDTFYEFTNRKIQIRNDKMNFAERPLPMIRMDGVFDNPIDVIRYNCKVSACDYWNEPYPVTNDILQMIMQYILEIDFKMGRDKDTSTPSELELDTPYTKNKQQ